MENESKPIAVVAMGGHAFMLPGEKGSIEEHQRNAADIANQLMILADRNYNLVITHGNGPQVGNLLLVTELTGEQVPPMPLDVLVAQTEGSLGYIMQQAILNLVLNSIQAMPAPAGGELSLGATRRDGYVRLVVSDTGPGIPTELADEVFEAGVTTKPGGSGLGLSLVRLIAESHGGRVSYRSVPGSGTSFILDLPTG